MLKLSDYYEAIKVVCDELSELPNYLKPLSIYRAGNIGSPGISDIDLIIGVDDNFCYGQELFYQFNKILDKIKHRKILFLHLPLLFANKDLSKLPYFSFNPINDLELLLGNDVFIKKTEICDDQILLRSMEFMHARIIDLLTQTFSREINEKHILVIGHSFIHSLKAINKINSKLNLKEDNFRTFCKIEEYRSKIASGLNVEINDSQCEELYKGICGEFYHLLGYFYDEIEKKVAFHWSKNFKTFQYHNKIYLRDLNKRSKNLNIEFKNGNYEIKGFSWEMKCLADNYFLENQNYSTIFLDKNFKNEIFKRKDYLGSIYNFNMVNFGNATGRSAFRTYAMGSVLDYLSLGINILK